MRSIIKLIAAVLGLSILPVACIDNSCISGYVFSVPTHIFPDDSDLHLGDTIKVLMLTDNTMLYDTIGDRFVNYPNFFPYADFSLFNLDTFPLKDGLDCMEIIPAEGMTVERVDGTSISDFIGFRDIDTTELQSRLEFDIVLKETGTYVLNGRNYFFKIDFRVGLDFPDRCGDGDLDMFFNYNDGDNHENILTEKNRMIEDSIWGRWTGSRRMSRPYYFRVVE